VFEEVPTPATRNAIYDEQHQQQQRVVLSPYLHINPVTNSFVAFFKGILFSTFHHIYFFLLK
jgi:hypothetical protein